MILTETHLMARAELISFVNVVYGRYQTYFAAVASRDINLVIAGPDRGLAVDALVVGLP